MAETAIGRVSDIPTKEWRGKTLYSIQLEGNDKYFGCGDVKPNCSVGDYITFQWGPNKKGYPALDLDTLALTDKAEAKAAGAATGDKQAVISWQSARNAALDFTRLALEADALDLGSEKTNKADRFETLMTYVQHTTEQFYDASTEIYMGDDESDVPPGS